MSVAVAALEADLAADPGHRVDDQAEPAPLLRGHGRRGGAGADSAPGGAVVHPGDGDHHGGRGEAGRRQQETGRAGSAGARPTAPAAITMSTVAIGHSTANARLSAKRAPRTTQTIAAAARIAASSARGDEAGGHE